MENKVCISSCKDYDYARVKEILASQFETLGIKNLIFPGCMAVIKVNLVIRATPASGIITHPVVAAAAGTLLQEMGANVLIAESPGGPYTQGNLKANYHLGGYAEMAEQYGLALNYNCAYSEMEVPKGRRSKLFPIIDPILNADLIVDIAKLKSHCMTGMSGAVKNMFGCVPGLMKPELHCRFPEKEDFSEMLVDLCEALSPQLTIVDAITCMEGNGPTGGRPRAMGALLSSRSPYAADVACASLINMEPQKILMLQAAMQRGLCPRSVKELDLGEENLASYVLEDFLQPESKASDFIQRVPRVFRPLAKRIATPIPKIRTKGCVGCGKCAESCPRHTIQIVDHKAQINYNNCIRCYCCHEMCPRHAVDIKRFRLFHW